MRKPKLYMVGTLVVTMKEAADLLNMKEDTLRKQIRRSHLSAANFLKDKLDVNNSHTTGE